MTRIIDMVDYNDEEQVKIYSIHLIAENGHILSKSDPMEATEIKYTAKTCKRIAELLQDGTLQLFDIGANQYVSYESIR